MKKNFYLRILMAVVFMFFHAKSFAQGVGDHITMSLQNCSQISLNTIQFDLYVVSDGAAGSDLRANSFQFGINFNSGILNGGTLSTSYISGTTEFPVLGGFSFPASSFPDHIRMVQSVYTGGNTGITMTLGHQYRVGTFRITNSMVWYPTLSVNFSLQDVTLGGHTVCAAIAWIGAASTTTSFITTGTGNGQRAVSSSCSLSIGNFDHNTVTGICFLDINNNGIQDNGEPGFHNVMVSSAGNIHTYFSIPNNQGVYNNLTIDTGVNINTSLINTLLYYTYSPSSHVSNFTSFNNTDSVNFALVPMPGVQDLRITLIPVTPARPGRSVTYLLTYSNVGTDTMSGTVGLMFDGRMTFNSSIPGYDSLNGNHIKWNYSNLLPNETRNINVYLTVSASVVVGDILVSNALIDPIATDTTPSDNTSNVEHHVVTSHDPNEKMLTGNNSLSITNLLNGEYLTYLIRFQNTGTDTAFKIVVRDTLDNKLDASSFEMISSSHNYTVSIENNRYVTWTFNNILLPDSTTNEAASHGYVCYRIKSTNTVTAGDVIMNTGYIYFDFNTPVPTNTVMSPVELFTTICECIFIPDFTLFPNPTNNALTIHYSLVRASSVRVELFNPLGQQINQLVNETQSAGAHDFIYNVKDLSSGIYFIKVSNDLETKIMKLLKE